MTLANLLCVSEGGVGSERTDAASATKTASEVSAAGNGFRQRAPSVLAPATTSAKTTRVRTPPV